MRYGACANTRNNRAYNAGVGARADHLDGVELEAGVLSGAAHRRDGRRLRNGWIVVVASVPVAKYAQ